MHSLVYYYNILNNALIIIIVVIITSQSLAVTDKPDSTSKLQTFSNQFQ